MERDYWKNMTDFTHKMATQIRDADPKNFTQQYTTRKRLEKQTNTDYPARGGEYGNYERFEKNEIGEEIEKGEDDYGKDQFFRNYNQMAR